MRWEEQSELQHNQPRSGGMGLGGGGSPRLRYQKRAEPQSGGTRAAAQPADRIKIGVNYQL